MTPRSALLRSVVAIVAIAPASTAAAQTASPNLEHVTNVPYEARNGTVPNYGTDIEFARVQKQQHAFAGSYRNGMQIFDLTDPSAPKRVGVYDCGIAQGDIQVFTRDDKPGRTFATYTADSNANATVAKSACFDEAVALGFDARRPDGTGRQGTFIVDVSNPRRPRTVSFVEVPKGSHNQTVHPSGRWLYNSNSELITNIAQSSIEIIDINDLSSPKVVKTFPLLTVPLSLGNDSHDITFSADGTRAYSAALSHEEIIDTTDPANPKRVGSIADPAINVFHQSDPITIGDRRVLVIEDEFAGAAANAACPSGGVHFYDITGELERSPVKLGYWNIDEAGPDLDRCTAHVFRLHDEQDLMTIAFYNAGVRVVDLKGVIGGTTAGGARQIAFSRFEDSDAWSAKTPAVEEDGDFFLYANDINRGLDVFEYDAQAQAADSSGFWVAGATSTENAVKADLSGYRLNCLLTR